MWWAKAVAQLTDHLLWIPEICRSNPVMGECLTNAFYYPSRQIEKTKVKERQKEMNAEIQKNKTSKMRGIHKDTIRGIQK